MLGSKTFFFYFLYSFDEKKWHCWSGTGTPELNGKLGPFFQLTFGRLTLGWGLLDFVYQIGFSPPTFSNSIVPVICERTAVMQDVLWGNTELEQITFHSDNGRLQKVTTYYSYLRRKFQW